jgi:microsomal epoxide hydrolase
MPFDTLPSKATLKPTPFKVNVSDKDLEECLQLVRLSKIGPVTWENQTTNPKSLTSFGVKRDWLADLKEQWGNGSYDWRKAEGRINRHPNFKVDIEYEGQKLDMHFAALFSKKADAVPLLFLHGWPGSFIEFLGVLNELSEKYDENSLPFHVVVPSLPGYVFSGGPPLDRDFIIEDVANVMDKLMLGLGFGDGYIVQGGDLGSYVARVIGVQSEACKAVHLNLCIGVVPESEEEEKSLSEKDQQAVNRIKDFTTMGSAYARFHGTRPSTIGLILSTTPLALLAWYEAGYPARHEHSAAY